MYWEHLLTYSCIIGNAKKTGGGISMKTTVRKMEGTPWHVEYMRREEGDVRRDRRRCERYHKEGSYCSIYCGKCHGSAHCPYYREAKTVSSGQHSSRNNASTRSVQQEFPFMSKVHHTRYGDGIVAGNQKGRIIVVFATKTKSFSALYCVEGGLLRRA